MVVDGEMFAKAVFLLKEQNDKIDVEFAKAHNLIDDKTFKYEKDMEKAVDYFLSKLMFIDDFYNSIKASPAEQDKTIAELRKGLDLGEKAEGDVEKAKEEKPRVASTAEMFTKMLAKHQTVWPTDESLEKANPRSIDLPEPTTTIETAPENRERFMTTCQTQAVEMGMTPEEARRFCLNFYESRSFLQVSAGEPVQKTQSTNQIFQELLRKQSGPK